MLIFGQRTVDKLVKVYLRNGADCGCWCMSRYRGLCSSRKASLPDGMFVYNYRIHDRFGVRCATFAVLTDDDAAWRPTALKQFARHRAAYGLSHRQR